MKDAMHKQALASPHSEQGQSFKQRFTMRCAVCSSHVWFDPVRVAEPPGTPDPHLSWLLCRNCYDALEEEMRRSPVSGPLRTRIAMGIVASERWPMAYPTRVKAYVYDRRWIVFIAAGCITAMLLHLLLILYIAMISHV